MIKIFYSCCKIKTQLSANSSLKHFFNQAKSEVFVIEVNGSWTLHDMPLSSKKYAKK